MLEKAGDRMEPKLEEPESFVASGEGGGSGRGGRGQGGLYCGGRWELWKVMCRELTLCSLPSGGSYCQDTKEPHATAKLDSLITASIPPLFPAHDPPGT